MSSIKENNKLGNRNQQHSNSGSTLTTSTSTNQTLKREQGNNNNTREEATAKRTKRSTTKVGLNDTLRRIRQLMVEGRNNSEIQDILQLEERTFYRYMAKIYEIDQALFAEQEKKTIKTEMSILKDRLLKSYRWCIAMADNENIKEDTRMQAQNLALEVAAAVLRLEAQGP